MMYRVLIEELATNRRRWCKQNIAWEEWSMFWWTEGNMCCDCNRKIEFYRAEGIELADDKTPCGDGVTKAYRVICAEVDGKRIEINN